MCATGRGACWQPRLIEHWLWLDQRLRQRNIIAVVSFLLPACLPVEGAKARASSKENRRIHLLSSVAEVVISGDIVPNASRKDLAKEVQNGSRTFYLGAAWSLCSELFATTVLRADVVLDCGATGTVGGVEGV